MRSHYLPLVFALAFGASAPYMAASESAKASLRWKLREGDQLRLQVTQTTKTETSVMGKATAMSIDTGLEMMWRVDNVERDGTMRMTLSFDRVKMKTTDTDGQAVVYDSSSAEAPLPLVRNMARDIRPLLSSRFAVAMSNRGEILEVTRREESDGQATKGPNASPWKGLMTKDGINQTLRQILGLLPEAPVAEGDKWASTYDVDSPLGKIRIANSLTCDGTILRNGRPYAKIAMVARVAPQKEAETPDTPAIPTSEKYVGVFYFDNVAGRLVHSEITQTTVSELPFKDTAIKVNASSTIVLSVTTVKGE